MEKKISQLLVLLAVLGLATAVSFKSLYDRELKSSYGF